MHIPSLFNGKKVTVMGLGLLGRGIGDVKFLAEEGADLIVTDLKTKEELQESLNELSHEKIGAVADKIKYVLGEHRLEDFKDRDFILKAAGIPLDSPYIKEAKKNKIPIEMSTSLFAAHTDATIVGVTGTRGKSTVTHLLYEVLREAFHNGKNHPRTKVFLGGNIKGVSTLPFLHTAEKGDIAVLELDSWQLQGFAERKISPHISIFTTFFPDHMNYYGNNMKTYLEDKAAIFKFQNDHDVLIMGTQAVAQITENFKEKELGKAKKLVVDEKYIPENWQLNIPGEHNRYNAGLVLAAARALDIPDILTQQLVENFKGVPGRLELVREYKGIKIYNDTTATTPDATLAGLKALADNSNNKRVILIMGGNDKNLDMSKLLEALPDFAKAIILIPGTGSTRIQPELKNIAGNFVLDSADFLDDAFQKALEAGEAGDFILFSPAFTSFGMFKNEFDRGEQFLKVVNSLD
jgi:UDP-N-acetylmuramoylalanine--D-glutamate ligase